MVSVECQLTVQDYLRAQRLHFRPKPAVQILYWLFAIALGLALIEEAWVIFRGGTLPHGWWILPAGLAYGAFLFLIFLPWRVAKIFRENAALSKPNRTELADEGLLFESARGQIRLPWALIKGWKFNRQMLLVYHSTVHFYLLPRRCFSNENDFDHFRAMLAKQVGTPMR